MSLCKRLSSPAGMPTLDLVQILTPTPKPDKLPEFKPTENPLAQRKTVKEKKKILNEDSSDDDKYCLSPNTS